MAQTAPSGVTMMLKALGVNPEIFTQVAGAVKEIAARLERIEKKVDELKEKLDGRGTN
jgi:hypothetical protein